MIDFSGPAEYMARIGHWPVAVWRGFDLVDAERVSFNSRRDAMPETYLFELLTEKEQPERQHHPDNSHENEEIHGEKQPSRRLDERQQSDYEYDRDTDQKSNRWKALCE